MKYLLFLTLICLASCKAQKEAQMTTPEDMELIASDSFSGIEDYEAAVIQDTKSLNKFYSRINKTRKPGLPVPMVDFSKNVLIVMCLGPQKGENQPLLKKTEADEEILITVALSETKAVSQDENSVISYPFYIYKMPNSSKSVNIKKMDF